MILEFSCDSCGKVAQGDESRTDDNGQDLCLACYCRGEADTLRHVRQNVLNHIELLQADVRELDDRIAKFDRGEL